jgi:predicted dinucleotide-binding enzyme
LHSQAVARLRVGLLGAGAQGKAMAKSTARAKAQADIKSMQEASRAAAK